jgi:carbon-monoxide dehydrogenase iron sulfur subunit
MQNHKKIIAITRLCTGCRSCEIACAVAHSQSKSVFQALFEMPLPRYSIEVNHYDGVNLPLACRHCEEPDCLFACKAGAITKDPATGQVQINLSKCVGCWMCVMVCPFGAATADMERGKAVKCDLCRGREEGLACVPSCPTKALVYGNIGDIVSREDAKTQ